MTSKAPSEAQERWEFQSKDGSWQPCRNVRDAAMWAADGWTIRQVELDTRPALVRGEVL